MVIWIQLVFNRINIIAEPGLSQLNIQSWIIQQIQDIWIQFTILIGNLAFVFDEAMTLS